MEANEFSSRGLGSYGGESRGTSIKLTRIRVSLTAWAYRTGSAWRARSWSCSHGLIATRQGLDTELTDATRFAPGYFTAIRAWVGAHITFPR
jgi:hypothetical protein